jgi:hypothetical protein
VVATDNKIIELLHAILYKAVFFVLCGMIITFPIRMLSQFYKKYPFQCSRYILSCTSNHNSFCPFLTASFIWFRIPLLLLLYGGQVFLLDFAPTMLKFLNFLVKLSYFFCFIICTFSFWLCSVTVYSTILNPMRLNNVIKLLLQPVAQFQIYIFLRKNFWSNISSGLIFYSIIYSTVRAVFSQVYLHVQP